MRRYGILTRFHPALQPFSAACAAGAGFAGLLGCSHPEGPVPFDPGLAATLDLAAGSAAAASGAPAVVVAVRVPDGRTWVGAYGEAAPGRPVTERDVFRLASLTKTYVASRVLQLATSGDLDLDAPVGLFVPSAPFANQVTLRMLLSHTGGLADYVTEPSILGDLDAVYAPEDLVAAMADEPLQFEPGTGYAYSNTDYVLLGMVLASRGPSWQDQVQADVLDLLGLSASPTGEPTVSGYFAGTDVSHTADPSVADAAGRMVGTAADVAAWGAALHQGELLPPDVVEQMATPTPASIEAGDPYGLGWMVDQADGETWIGHSGSILGFQSRLRVGSDGTSVATLVNDFTVEADAIDVAVWEALGWPSP